MTIAKQRHLACTLGALLCCQITELLHQTPNSIHGRRTFLLYTKGERGGIFSPMLIVGVDNVVEALHHLVVLDQNLIDVAVQLRHVKRDDDAQFH